MRDERFEREPQAWPRELFLEFAGVLTVVLAALLISSHAPPFAAHMRSTPYNQAVRAAYGWLQGHFWISWPGPYLEALSYNGQHYPQYPPFPALLTLPFVMLLGEEANQTAVSMMVCLVAVAFAWMLLYRLGVPRVARILLTLFFFAGTDLWWCAQLGDVWFFAHVAAVACTMIVLWELCGERRGWLVALFAFFAFESRAVLLLALPLYAFLLAKDDLVRLLPGRPPGPQGGAVPRLRNFGIVLALGAVVYVAFNYAKWGVPYDAGYGLYYHQEAWGQPTGSPFRLSYLPYEIYSFFMRPPELKEWLQQAQYPIFNVNMNGVALTFTSPALILAFLARLPRRLSFALWGTVVLILIPNLLYYLNGWYQFGMRHALDFEPFLLVLMAFAVRDRLPRWGTVFIAYSMLVGVWGVWWWNTFVRQND